MDLLHALVLISESVRMAEWLIRTLWLPRHISSEIYSMFWDLLDVSDTFTRARVLWDVVYCVVNSIFMIHSALSIAN